MTKPLTMNEALKLRRGQIVYTPGYYNADGTTQRWRVKGAVKTWVKSPGRFKIPIKHGMIDYFYIDETNVHKFTVIEPPKRKK